MYQWYYIFGSLNNCLKIGQLLIGDLLELEPRHQSNKIPMQIIHYQPNLVPLQLEVGFSIEGNGQMILEWEID